LSSVLTWDVVFESSVVSSGLSDKAAFFVVVSQIVRQFISCSVINVEISLVLRVCCAVQRPDFLHCCERRDVQVFISFIGLTAYLAETTV
jgi:hypothetical protein